MATDHSLSSDNVFPSMVEVQGHPMEGEYQPLTISTARGSIQARLYEAPEPLAGVVLVGDGEDFASPADKLYERLGEELSRQGIAVLWVQFRHPTEMPDAEHDVLAGCRILLDLGVEKLALVGYAFGGTAIVRAAAWEPEAVAVVALAAPSPDTESSGHLKGRHVLLLANDDPTVFQTVVDFLERHLSGSASMPGA